jgi:long-chain acyl-CoA synthetase
MKMSSTHLRAVAARPLGDGFLERFDARATATPDAVAIEVDDPAAPRRVTYGELRSMVERYRGALAARGVRAGDAVLVMLPSGPEIVACLFAVVSLSAVFLPASPGLRPFELAPILRDARPAGAVVDDDALAAQLAHLRFVARPRELDEGATSALDAPHAHALATCHFTYKGLGYPLGAMHGYDAYTACIGALAERWAHAADGTHLVVLPLYPVYALVASALLPLSLGARVVVVPRLAGRNVLDLLVAHRARFACLVPLLFAQLAAQARAAGRPRVHPGLELVSGGSFLPPSVSAAVEETLGVEPLQGYGLTETLPVTVSFPDRGRRGTLGVPIGGDARVTVVDGTGREVARGRTGEVVVSGPTVTRGYVGRAAETARFLRAGRFHTGDLGAIDDGGFLRFVGRSLAITKCASQMVDLVEVERLLERHPKIAAARVTVTEDPRIGERLHATVALEGRASMEAREVIAYVRQHLSSHKVPRDVEIVHRERLGRAVGA